MFKLFRDSFKTANDCIIIAAPLIVFLSILGWYFDYTLSAVDTIPKALLALVTTLVMLSGFVSAWLYMAKKAITLSRSIVVLEKDRGKALLNLVASLPKGIGRLFLPMLGVIGIYMIVYILLLSGSSVLVSETLGSVDISMFDISSIQVSSVELLEEIKLFTKDELVIIGCWGICNIIGAIIISFITMLWVPEIVYSQKNPYKALFLSIKKVFKSFWKSLGLFIFINFIIISCTILNTLLMINPILYFIVLIVYYYFLVYIVVLLFEYYEQTYLKEN